jgi:pimeloyl-ACP methyl ester carboxylesterase
VPGCSYRPSWIYRLVALRGLGELLSLGGSAKLYKAALARCFHAPDRREVDFFVDHGYASRTDGVARAAYLATLRDVRVDFETHCEDYRRALTTLQLPVLLIPGRQDRVVPAEHCAEVAGVLRHAAVRWVDACGHFPQIEHVEAVNGWLVDFLVGRPAPR